MSAPKNELYGKLRDNVINSMELDIFATIPDVFVSWNDTLLREMSNIIHVRIHRGRHDTGRVSMVADLWLARDEIRSISPTKLQDYSKKYGRECSFSWKH